MKQTTLPDRIPSAPEQYDQAHMDRLIGMLNQQFTALSGRRKINGTTMNLSDLPTSATGLRPGDIWNDSGTLRIV